MLNDDLIHLAEILLSVMTGPHKVGAFYVMYLSAL